MTHFLELLLNGLSLGCIYALIALGFVVVFKATDVVNFAHGSLLLLGALRRRPLHDEPRLLGRAARRRRRRARSSPRCRLRARCAGCAGAPTRGTLAIVTIGVDIVLATELTRRIGTDLLATGDPWGRPVRHLGAVTIAADPHRRRRRRGRADRRLPGARSGTPTGASRCAPRPTTRRPRR